MATLLGFGFGYSVQYYLASYDGRFDHIYTTVRNTGHAAELNSLARPGVVVIAFDDKVVSADLHSAIEDADAVLVSVPPDDSGDPVLATCGNALSRASRLRSIMYLSTIGVYGNYDGAWVDEDSGCRPSYRRNHTRLAAEKAWQNLGICIGVPVAILRLAGIYGPGRNALENMRRGTAKRIAKSGQVFNRIHVFDIAQAIDAAFERCPNGIFNSADDQPSSPSDPILFAARLLGIEPPQEVSFSEARAAMTELAASFYFDVKRVRNTKLKSVLGVRLRYPTFREGLTALHQGDKWTPHEINAAEP
jgi:nucleoside-diphosphate-sugar epimerase